MIIDTITTRPLLFPIFLIVTIFVGTVIFFFNVLWWSPTGKTRKSNFSKCAKPSTLKMIIDRLLRAGNDQWLLAVILGCSIFILIFLIVFYSREGVETFSPLPVAPDAGEISNYVIMKLLQAAVLFTSAAAFMIAMYTGSDSLMRLMTDYAMMPNMENRMGTERDRDDNREAVLTGDNDY
jgi:hypothetical protein